MAKHGLHGLHNFGYFAIKHLVINMLYKKGVNHKIVAYSNAKTGEIIDKTLSPLCPTLSRKFVFAAPPSPQESYG
jgi:hypothetical protein